MFGLKKLSTTILGFLLILILANCGSAPQSPPTTKSIAILPVETVFTGKYPKDVTPEVITKMEERESKTFQVALHDQLIRNVGKCKNNVTLSVQNYARTNSLLQKNGISIRQSWDTDPSEIAQFLKVDEVVKARIVKRQYISDMGGLGVDLAKGVAGMLDNRVGNVLKRAKSSDVKVSCSLVNLESQTVWNLNENTSTNFSNNADKVVDDISKTIAKKFPYRK